MKKIWLPITVAFAVAMMASCGNGKQNQAQNANTASAQDTSRDGLIKAVNAADAHLKTLTTGYDAYSANLAITAYITFVKYFPNDTLSPVFLYKAGQVSSNSGQFQRAINFYDQILTKYPNYRQTPDCLFIEGFVYEDKLKDTAKAHAKFNELIQKFPNNHYVPDAQQEIHNLGKSPDELIKEFEKKNKQQQGKKSA